MDKSPFQPSSRLGKKLYLPLIVLAIISLVGAGVTVYFATHNLMSTYEDLLAAFAVVIMVGTVVLVTLSIRSVMRNVITPIDNLRVGMNQLSRGIFDHTIRVSTDDELEQLAHDFNIMSAALFEAQQALADAAEENAQLLHQTEAQLSRRIRELNGLRRINQTLNQTLSLNSILQVIAKEASAATNASFCAILIRQNGTLRPIAHVGALISADELADLPAITQAIDTQEPLILAEHRAEMVVPIQPAETLIGVLYLADDALDSFTGEQLPYIQTLADQAAIAHRQAEEFQARVTERLQNITRINQLARLSNINRAFRANLPLANILEEIAFAVQETAGFNIVLVSVMKRRHLEHIAGAGLPVSQLNAIQKTRTPRAEIMPLLQPAFSLGDSYFIPTEAEKEIPSLNILFSAPMPKTHRWQKRDLLFTPLHNTDGTLIGLLTVLAPTDGERPTEKSVTVLELFANQAAMFIENTQQFMALTRQATRLQLISQIHTRMSSILHLAELMGEVARLIANAFNYYHVQIFRVDDQSPQTLVLQNCAGTANVPPEDLSPTRMAIDESSIVGWAASH